MRSDLAPREPQSANTTYCYNTLTQYYEWACKFLEQGVQSERNNLTKYIYLQL